MGDLFSGIFIELIPTRIYFKRVGAQINLQSLNRYDRHTKLRARFSAEAFIIAWEDHVDSL